MTSTTPPSERMPSLTGLRFVAAFGVFVCHAAFLSPRMQGRSWTPTELLGPVAVSLFFILSGFVLTRFRRPGDTARAFWRRRVVKIYPNHLTAWALFMIYFLSIGVAVRQSGSVLALVPGVLLVHTWLPKYNLIGSGNIVAWSLACEVFFYLLFPLLLALVRRIPPRRLAAAAVCMAAAVWTVPVVSYALGGALLPGFPWPVPRNQLWFAYFLPLCRLPEFVLGIILAIGMRSDDRKRRIGVGASAALLLASLALGATLLPPVFLFAAVGVVPLTLLIRATAALDLRGARSPLRTPVMVFLGEISYAFYLVHALALLVVYEITGDAWAGLATGVLGLPVALLMAWLLYTLVERPCMRRFARRRRPAPGSAPAQAAAGAEKPERAA
ncbi:acyltransferase [Streptomyces sp. XD-27]|uniref:acyltransferase family protein n=1 Tax=Streptomyces sp. XD-27 TaxID=3062779 RepID=UPI0026F44E4F|nr:acyltransferase [Streptomyces sp. XD-27]WKX70377.1 acyltransferase [Streptomyces sp. XD-27]